MREVNITLVFVSLAICLASKDFLTKIEKIISNLIDEKYNGEESTKKIIILQQFEAPTWNITYVTSAMNVLNVKIDATNGKIISEKLFKSDV